MRLFGNASYRFIQARKTAYVVSAVTVFLGLAAMAANIFLIGSWQNYGVDFTGGSWFKCASSSPSQPPSCGLPSEGQGLPDPELR